MEDMHITLWPPPAAVEVWEVLQEVEAHELLQMSHFPCTPAVNIARGELSLTPNKNAKNCKFSIKWKLLKKLI